MKEIKYISLFRLINQIYKAFDEISVKKYYLLLFLSIIFTRIMVIILTPQSYDFADPVIYRMTGQLAASGINPYDFDSDLLEREAIASNWMRAHDSFMNNGIDDFNYYVSANLPASTILYVLMHNLSNNDPFIWRTFLIFGDLFILFCFMLLSLQLSISLKSTKIKIGSLFLFVLYPSLILNGTAIPEDKQFQTALLFLGLAAILTNIRSENLKGLCVGFSIGIGVLFKFFSAFLLPLYLLSFLKQGWKFRIVSMVAGISLLFISVCIYGIDFIETMAARSVRSSVSVAQHSSVWTLFQSKIDIDIFYLKTIICSAIIFYIIKYMLIKKIDILNATAAFLLVFSVIWLMDGSINRANISMIFASGILLLTNQDKGLILIFLNFIAQCILIILMIFLEWGLGFYEAIASLFFLLSYFSLSFSNKSIFRNKKLDLLLPVVLK